MLTIVNKKPAQVWSVSAVPTCVRAQYSLTSAENCGGVGNDGKAPDHRKNQ